MKKIVGDGLAHPAVFARHEINFQNLNFQILLTFENAYKTFS
jgi:hypothetical protein